MADAPWPSLRQELSMTKGPVSSYGAPTFTLHDPVGHRFFRLGWLEMEIIQRWALADPEAIARDIAENTTLAPSPDDVKKVMLFVQHNALSQPIGPADTARLNALAERQKTGPFMFLVKNYLFLRVPLFKPDAFLSRTLPLVRPFFSPTAFWAVSLLAILGLFLVLRNLSFFQHDLTLLFSVQGAVMVLIAMGISKAVHELAHAYAAKLLNLRVPAIGIALMCFYPMLWTDTTEAWKCARRQDRLLIGLAGVGAELALAALASLAWLLLPQGLVKDMALTLAGVTWLTTLAVNANPFMRYDAYYILSDLFEMPMLQNRCFALGKWFLRGKLLGLHDESPEAMDTRRMALCILYAYATWIYRFFLFLGIAFLVYHMFFKALGLLLFMVEMVWFLAWPIVKELREWCRLRHQARLTVWGALLIALVFSLLIPWRAGVVAPAILDAEKTFTFHAPVGGQLVSSLPPIGQRVHAGDIILRLDSPDLEFKLHANALAEKSLEQQLANVGLAAELFGQYAARKEELAGVMAEGASLVARKERLKFTAPFEGEVRESAVDITPGQWVGVNERLVFLTGGRAVVEAMVPEEDIVRLAVGDRGIFISDSGGEGPFDVEIASISPGTVSELTKPALASVKGGQLPVRQSASGQLKPERAVYLVRCEVKDSSRLPAAVTGLANLKGERHSVIGRALSHLSAMTIRESGL